MYRLVKKNPITNKNLTCTKLDGQKNIKLDDIYWNSFVILKKMFSTNFLK